MQSTGCHFMRMSGAGNVGSLPKRICHSNGCYASFLKAFHPPTPFQPMTQGFRGSKFTRVTVHLLVQCPYHKEVSPPSKEGTTVFGNFMEGDYTPFKLFQSIFIEFLMQWFIYQVMISHICIFLYKMNRKICEPRHFSTTVATVNNPKSVALKELNAN